MRARRSPEYDTIKGIGIAVEAMRSMGIAISSKHILLSAVASSHFYSTILKVWRRGSSFDPQRGSLDAWILLNARSLAIDLLRRRTLEARSLSSGRWHSDVSDELSPESYAEHRDLMRRARNAMDRLPHGQRSAVELSYLGQRSSTQVAELQGIPRGTVKSRVRAGIATLRQTLSDQENR